MSKEIVNLWTRDIELEVVYDWFEDEEELLPAQEEAVKELLEQEEIFDEVLPELKNYCIEKNPEEFPSKSIDNIFKYIIPEKLYIMRTGKDRTVALLCDYKYDLEHGIAIVFKNEKFEKIGDGDIVL